MVGAGPVGLTTALDLRRRGIPTTVIEKNVETYHGGSRAIVLDQYALEVVERNGANRILEENIRPSGRDTYFGDVRLYGSNFPDPAEGELPLAGIIPQFDTESALVEAASDNPDAINMLWGHEVVGIKETSGGVILTVKNISDGKIFDIEAPFAVACDGSRSSVRKMLKVGFPGFTDSSDFIIADVKIDLGDSRLAKFTFAPTAGHSQTQLLVPEPNGIWRMDWQLFPGEDPNAKMTQHEIGVMIRETVGADLPFEVIWVSSYRFHQRVIETFRQGNVFFAGDSAHLVAPFGGRGMNSGIRDAVNLSWKIAQVLKKEAPPSLLESYHAERSAAAQENQAATIASMRFISPVNEESRKRRDEILRLSVEDPSIRAHVNSGVPSRPESNAESSLNYGDHPLIGKTIADLKVGVNGERLRHIVGNGFTVIEHKDSRISIDGLTVPQEESEDAIRKLQLSEGQVMVVRPDGYVGAVCSSRSDLYSAMETMQGARE